MRRPRPGPRGAVPGPGYAPVLGLVLGLILATAAGLAAPAAFGQDGDRHGDRLRLPGIQGDDDRRRIASTDWPWTAIGRVNRTTGGYCTGALVAPDRVLTAAHCLWDPRQGRMRPASVFYFITGYDRGAMAAHAGVSGYRVAPGYRPAEREDPRQALNDWAVLTLESPIETVPPLPMLPLDGDALAAAAAEGRLMQAGYSQDRPHMLSIDLGCPVDRLVADGRLVVHGCDAVSGDSGSPLLVLRSPPADPGTAETLMINGGVGIAGLHIGSALATGPSGRSIDGRGLAVPAASFAEAVLAPVTADGAPEN